MKLIRIAGYYVNPERVSSLEVWQKIMGVGEPPEARGTLINTDHGTICIETLTPARVAEILQGEGAQS